MNKNKFNSDNNNDNTNENEKTNQISKWNIEEIQTEAGADIDKLRIEIELKINEFKKKYKKGFI